MNLIPRFYDVTEGAVTIDGVDVRKLSQHQLREIIGYVPQKGMLFSGTVASNLRYGKEDATGQELQAALATAQAADFVNAMDEGVDSPGSGSPLPAPWPARRPSISLTTASPPWTLRPTPPCARPWPGIPKTPPC